MNIQHPDIVVRHVRTKNKIRKIVAYRSDDGDLRNYHRNINAFLRERFAPSIFAKGYVKGRSIYHNALSHMYNDYFIMLDIKDFFPNICHTQLSRKIYFEINLLKPDQISKKECNDIVEACSISSRGIPLGFVTSPILSNIYLKEFDNVFYGMLKKIGLDNAIYTRYADDMTISFRRAENTEPLDEKAIIIEFASSILSRYGLQLNQKKTRSYSLNISNHVRVTGVNITKQESGQRKLTVGRSIKNQLYWDALNCFWEKDSEKIQHVKGMQSFILSIEKNGFEKCYSSAMLAHVHELGFDSLKSLIDSL
ncbi:MAG: reverse transcriptase domain-containing protein [Christensenellales bacterium]|jgi:RNA-directed DNA polymerase